MEIDDILRRSAENITRITNEATLLKHYIKHGNATNAAASLGKLLAAVDDLRSAIPVPTYSPAVGDVVWALATVERVNDYGTVRLRTGKGSYDYVTVDSNETLMRIAYGFVGFPIEAEIAEEAAPASNA